MIEKPTNLTELTELTLLVAQPHFMRAHKRNTKFLSGSVRSVRNGNLGALNPCGFGGAK